MSGLIFGPAILIGLIWHSEPAAWIGFAAFLSLLPVALALAAAMKFSSSSFSSSSGLIGMSISHICHLLLFFLWFYVFMVDG